MAVKAGETGAAPFSFEGNGSNARTGVLLVHGFTGSPTSMLGWGEHLAAEGYTVVGPLLPGHGTRWQDMNRCTWQDWVSAMDSALSELASRVDEVFVFGLSMGGTLTLRLAQTHPELKGIVVVNASLATQRKDAMLLPLFKNFIGSFPGIVNDIKKPGMDEQGYGRLPLKAAYELRTLWGVVRGDLSTITCPVLYFRSRTDHVVEAISGTILMDGLSATQATEVVLEDSFHVATMDNDAPQIFASSVDFIHAHSSTRAAS